MADNGVDPNVKTLLERLVSGEDSLEPNEVKTIDDLVESGVLGVEESGNLLVRLGNNLFNQYIDTGINETLDKSIQFYRRGREILTPTMDFYSDSLTNLAASLGGRYDHSGDLKDLEEAISLEKEAISFSPPDHPNLSLRLFNLSESLKKLHHRSGDFEDLENAMLLVRGALSLCPPGHSNRPNCLIGLASSLKKQYERSGDFANLKEAMSLEREVISLCPPGDPDRSTCLVNLAGSLMRRYNKLGDFGDLEEAVSLGKEALPLWPPNHPSRSTCLINLTSALIKQYNHSEEFGVLEEAISLGREALLLCPPGHPNRSLLLNNLSISLGKRYHRFGDLRDLEEVTPLRREALSLCPPGHYSRSLCLIGLATSLKEQYDRSGDVKNLEEAILLEREAVSLRPPGHSGRSLSLTNLASSLKTQYNRSEELDYLKEAISLEKEALSLRPPGHPERTISLRNLARSVMKQYTHSGDFRNLEEAVSLEEEALSLCHPGHSDRSLCLINLAVSLMKRYDQAGDVRDLENAMTLGREALLIQPSNHSSLNSFSGILKKRYNQSKDLRDLEEALSLTRDTLSLCPSGHSDRPLYLSNLAATLIMRYDDQSGDSGDLEEAISLGREALLLCAPGHPERSAVLNNLSGSLKKQYNRSRDFKDLEEALALEKEALSLCLHGHGNRSYCLNNLAHSLAQQYLESQDPKHLEEAVSLGREALSLCPVGHPTRSLRLSNLAAMLVTKELDQPDHQNNPVFGEAQDCIIAAISHSFSSVLYRLSVAYHWADTSYFNVPFRLTVYALALDLLQQFLIVHPDVLEQQTRLLSVLSTQILASDAASVAIEAGDIWQAVLLLDHGRSLLLGTLKRYRTPLDSLRAVNDELATQLQSVGSQLERLSASPPADEPKYITTLDHAFQTQRRLLGRWEELLVEIRNLSGFESFLLPPAYDSLRAAAKDGPIIILNSSDTRCDAIIVSFTGPPALIALPSISVAKLEGYSKDLVESRLDPRNQKTPLRRILRSLWHEAVSPIVECLKSIGVPLLSRVWWIPSSSFSTLPLHAAGLYDGSPESDFPSLYISSYASTISDLLRAKADNDIRNPADTDSPKPQLLFIGHAGGNLAHVREELSTIRTVQRLDTNAILEGSAVPTEVLGNLPKYSWLHFCCHGVVLPEWPLNSYFQLQNSQLEVKDIITAHLTKAEFAFLSACHSAAPGELLPNESIHLASALQFAGFRSVVGTMWEMFDNDGPAITKDFYTRLMKLGGRYTDAAKALHYAIRRCAVKKKGPERWAMFVHIGA